VFCGAGGAPRQQPGINGLSLGRYRAHQVKPAYDVEAYRSLTASRLKAGVRSAAAGTPGPRLSRLRNDREETHDSETFECLAAKLVPLRYAGTSKSSINTALVASTVPPHLSHRHKHTAEDTKPRGLPYFNIVVLVPSEFSSPPNTPLDPLQASCSPPKVGTDTPAPVSHVRTVAERARKWCAVRHDSSTMRPRSAAACPLAKRQRQPPDVSSQIMSAGRSSGGGASATRGLDSASGAAVNQGRFGNGR